jgi:hypothetical protein
LSSAIRTGPVERHASNSPQGELSMRLYDLPAFREWQERMADEALRGVAAHVATHAPGVASHEPR